MASLLQRHEPKSACGICHVHSQVNNIHYKPMFQTELYTDELCHKAVYIQLYTGLFRCELCELCELSVLVSILGMDCRSVTLFFPLSRH